jgi:hypothetical protein
VRQGASWTAAYHRRLTVAAVARPVPSSVGAPGVLAAERSWWLLAQTTSARRSVQPLSSGRASSPWSTLPAGKPRRRSPVSSMRCPPIRVRRPGSGCPAVRCPVTWVVVQRVRRSAVCCPPVQRPAVCCPPVQRPAVCCPPVQCPAVWCLPRPSGRVRLLPPQAGGVGDPGRGGRATMTTGTGGGPCGRRAVDGSTTVEEVGTRATLPTSGWSVGGRWRTRAAGLVRAAAPRLTPERPGRPGRRAERPSRAAARWAREQAAARGGCIRRVAAVLGWVRDHGAWSSPSLTAGWAAPAGPLEVPAGMGVRPQRGPSRRRALLARC